MEVQTLGGVLFGFTFLQMCLGHVPGCIGPIFSSLYHSHLLEMKVADKLASLSNVILDQTLEAPRQ